MVFSYGNETILCLCEVRHLARSPGLLVHGWGKVFDNGRKWRLLHEVSGIQCTLSDYGWVITRTNGEKDSLAQRCCLEVRLR